MLTCRLIPRPLAGRDKANDNKSRQDNRAASWPTSCRNKIASVHAIIMRKSDARTRTHSKSFRKTEKAFPVDFARSALGVRCVLASLSSSPLHSCAASANLLPRKSAKQKDTQHDKENIGKPDQQLRMHLRIAAQRIADDDKKKISSGNNQTHGEPD